MIVWGQLRTKMRLFWQGKEFKNKLWFRNKFKAALMMKM